jgi:hypothetical protein
MHFAIDHAEQGHEELSEPAQVEDANTKQEQSKPWCIHPPSLNFVYKYILIMILDCALGCRSWIDTLVTLELLSNLSILTLWLTLWLEIGR